jgi:hypothetical protein
MRSLELIESSNSVCGPDYRPGTWGVNSAGERLFTENAVALRLQPRLLPYLVVVHALLDLQTVLMALWMC